MNPKGLDASKGSSTYWKLEEIDHLSHEIEFLIQGLSDEPGNNSEEPPNYSGRRQNQKEDQKRPSKSPNERPIQERGAERLFYGNESPIKIRNGPNSGSDDSVAGSLEMEDAHSLAYGRGSPENIQESPLIYVETINSPETQSVKEMGEDEDANEESGKIVMWKPEETPNKQVESGNGKKYHRKIDSFSFSKQFSRQSSDATKERPSQKRNESENKGVGISEEELWIEKALYAFEENSRLKSVLHSLDVSNFSEVNSQLLETVKFVTKTNEKLEELLRVSNDRIMVLRNKLSSALGMNSKMKQEIIGLAKERDLLLKRHKGISENLQRILKQKETSNFSKGKEYALEREASYYRQKYHEAFRDGFEIKKENGKLRGLFLGIFEKVCRSEETSSPNKGTGTPSNRCAGTPSKVREAGSSKRVSFREESKAKEEGDKYDEKRFSLKDNESEESRIGKMDQKRRNSESPETKKGKKGRRDSELISYSSVSSKSGSKQKLLKAIYGLSDEKNKEKVVYRSFTKKEMKELQETFHREIDGLLSRNSGNEKTLLGVSLEIERLKSKITELETELAIYKESNFSKESEMEKVLNEQKETLLEFEKVSSKNKEIVEEFGKIGEKVDGMLEKYKFLFGKFKEYAQRENQMKKEQDENGRKTTEKKETKEIEEHRDQMPSHKGGTTQQKMKRNELGFEPKQGKQHRVSQISSNSTACTQKTIPRSQSSRRRASDGAYEEVL